MVAHAPPHARGQERAEIAVHRGPRGMDGASDRYWPSLSAWPSTCWPPSRRASPGRRHHSHPDLVKPTSAPFRNGLPDRDDRPHAAGMAWTRASRAVGPSQRASHRRGVEPLASAPVAFNPCHGTPSRKPPQGGQHPQGPGRGVPRSAAGHPPTAFDPAAIRRRVLKSKPLSSPSTGHGQRHRT